MTERPFVARFHLEPAASRRDVVEPEWQQLAEFIARLGDQVQERIELYGRHHASVMSIEAYRGAFHISIQVGESHYFCFRGSPADNRMVVDLGAFAFQGDEICHDKVALTNIARQFWLSGERWDAASWNSYAAGDGLSPLNNIMAKASAEVGAMVQAHQAGKKGGDGAMRVKGEWNASPATRSDMKVLARQMDLDRLTITDSDGTTHVFSGAELLPISSGGKAW